MTSDKPMEPERVACEVCLKEVPRSEAKVPEATDYVAYFCGLECYEAWRKQGAQASKDTPGAASKAGPSGG